MLEQLARYSRIFGFVLYCTGMALFRPFGHAFSLILLGQKCYLLWPIPYASSGLPALLSSDEFPFS